MLDRPLALRAPRDRLAFVASVCAVLTAALALRLAGASDAFVAGELVPLDGDSLYHLRRIRWIADAFPAVLWRDPMIAWPDGGPVPWAAGFDVLGALLLFVGRAIGGATGGDLAVGSIGPLLGIAVVGATVGLAHALLAGHTGRRSAALAAGVLAAAIPQGLATSRFGRIDHHAAEALAMLLLAGWALAALRSGVADRGRRVAFEVAGAALSGSAVAVFTGSPLYVALVLPILFGAAIAAPRPTVVGSGGPGLLAGAGLAALASAPAVAAHGQPLAFGFPSWLQPLLLAAAGAAVSGVAVLGTRLAPGRRRGLAVLGGVGAAAVAVAVAAPAGAAQAAAGLREWLFKADPWLRGIDEFQPLLADLRGPAAGVTRFFGAIGFAAPVLVPLAALGALRAGRARAAAFVWLAVALAALTLLQARFGRVFIPFLAVSAALALAWAGARLPWRWRAARHLALAASLTVAALDPRVRAAAGPAASDEPDAAVEAAFDLRARTPGPAPGVLAPWDLGNAFLVVGHRPVVATGFGPYPDAAAYWESVRAYTVPEAELLPWLAGRRVGWVVAGAANLFGRVTSPGAAIPFEGRGYSLAWLKRVPSAPLLVGGSGVPELGIRHFERLRPVFASTRAVKGIDRPPPVLWTYEVVAGARLSGTAPPGARVVLEIPLLEHGRRHTWRAFTDAGEDGGWTLVVPLPTGAATGAITTGPGSLRVGAGPPAPVRIPEAAVRSGDSVTP
jgi:asparagine N-glycosylation enzyme membrane subunit Stt3